MKPMPPNFVAYRRTRHFTEADMPEALTRRHDTRPGAWARIVVLEGALDYEIMTEPAEHVRVDAAHPGVIEEQVPHRVVPLETPLAFYVEFYKRAETEASSLARSMDAEIFSAPGAGNG